jgi:hypothetical protein
MRSVGYGDLGRPGACDSGPASAFHQWRGAVTKAQSSTESPDDIERGDARVAARPSWSPTAIAQMLLAGSILASTALLVGAGVLTWRWADQHLLHPGLASTQQATVSRTQLIREVQAFQLVTVKQTYAARTQQSVTQAFNLGANRITLPGWLAGEQVTVQGQAQVLAGVDLAQVRPEDIVVRDSGKTRTVQITIPAPQILSTELVPDTLRVSTSVGLLPQIEQALGISDDQLRVRSADLLLQAGQQAAQQQGIEASAATEAQRRLTDFLQSLPASGNRVTYTVTVKRPSA